MILSTNTTTLYILIFAINTLNSFLFFRLWGQIQSCVCPIALASQTNTLLSAIQAQRKPANAKARMKILKSKARYVNCMNFIKPILGSKSRYVENNNVATIVITKGKFCDMDCRKGGPMLSTIPENIYWKQEMRKRTVFCEFSTLDFCLLSLGGMYLRDPLEYSRGTRRIMHHRPRLSLNSFKSNKLYKDTDYNLAQQRCQNLS